MEMVSIGFLVGAITAIIFVGIGVQIGRLNQDDTERELDGDTDTRLYVPSRDRNRRSLCGDGEQNEIVPVLESLRFGSSRTEREALDIAIQYINYAEEVRGNAME